ncbi:MAG: DNA helicase PcrA [Patescibacteria group bacterium]|nr:MAG: DNA helicase PcrA [Patescibacteria group bacterium]
MAPLLSGLNPVQKEAVAYTAGPSLVVAGPGSGKTRVLTHKIAYLIKKRGVGAENILAVTFTNKAAEEMRERVLRLLENWRTEKSEVFSDPPAPNIWIGTFHATCAKILRKDGQPIGVPISFVIYDENDRRNLIKTILKEMGISGGRFSPAAISAAISNAKNELINPEEYGALAEGYFQETVGEIFPRYQKKLKEANALDFDDLLSESVRLLKGQRKVLSRWQDRFHHILVDEYQDTNRAQYALVQLLSQRHQNLTVVGDMSQAIYSWRGADFRNILRFEKDYPQAQVFHLAQNYRSTKNILGAAKALIEHNRTHISLDLQTQNGEGLPIVLYAAENELDESFYISSQITAMLAEKKANSFSDFAVLYRTNAQSRALEETFMRTGLPYILIGGVKFYERKEIKDVLAYLRLLANPKDSVSRKRAEKIGKRRLQKFTQWADAEVLNLEPVQILDQILERTGYLDYLDDGTREGQSRIENVKELRSVATGFNALPRFLEHVALVQPTDRLPTRALNRSSDSVTFMTLHAAKGLEFPTVFITGLEEGLLPHSRSMGSPEEVEEERRLCYVGITRAQKNLHLCFAHERLFFGSRATSTPSRFLTEIGDEHLVYHLPPTEVLSQ